MQDFLSREDDFYKIKLTKKENDYDLELKKYRERIILTEILPLSFYPYSRFYSLLYTDDKMPLPSFEPHHRNIHKTCADIRLSVWCQPTIFKKSKRMNEIQIFNNDQFGNVRVTMNENNEPMFCLADVCVVLGLTPSKVVQRLEEDVLSKYPP